MVPYVGFSTVSRSGCGYSTFLRPCFRSTKSSTMPAFIGPGRYSATAAMMSSNRSGLSFLISSWKPLDSHWNTPTV